MTHEKLQKKKEYTNWVTIPDYLYACRNLDNDERLILGVIISFEADGKSCFMTKETFADTYNMSVSTVKRKFANLSRNGLVKTTNGLVIDWDGLEHWLNVTKVIRTKKAGPGRGKNQNDTKDQNQIELEENQNDTTQNQVESTQNQNDSNKRIKMILAQNQNESTQNQIEPTQNQNDTQLEKVLEKVLEQPITNTKLENNIRTKIKNTITSEVTSFDDFIEDGKNDTKPKTIEEQELLDFLAELDI